MNNILSILAAIKTILLAPYYLCVLIAEGPGMYAPLWWMLLVVFTLISVSEIYLIYAIFTRKKRIEKKNRKVEEVFEKTRENRRLQRDKILQIENVEPSNKPITTLHDEVSSDWMTEQKKEEKR